jgi:hypothetical protein
MQTHTALYTYRPTTPKPCPSSHGATINLGHAWHHASSPDRARHDQKAGTMLALRVNFLRCASIVPCPSDPWQVFGRTITDRRGSSRPRDPRYILGRSIAGSASSTTVPSTGGTFLGTWDVVAVVCLDEAWTRLRRDDAEATPR